MFIESFFIHSECLESSYHVDKNFIKLSRDLWRIKYSIIQKTQRLQQVFNSGGLSHKHNILYNRVRKANTRRPPNVTHFIIIVSLAFFAGQCGKRRAFPIKCEEEEKFGLPVTGAAGPAPRGTPHLHGHRPRRPVRQPRRGAFHLAPYQKALFEPRPTHRKYNYCEFICAAPRSSVNYECPSVRSRPV